MFHRRSLDSFLIAGFENDVALELTGLPTTRRALIYARKPPYIWYRDAWNSVFKYLMRLSNTNRRAPI